MLSVITTLFLLLMIIAAAGDVLTRRIPNLLVLLVAALFFPAAWEAGMPPTGILLHAAAGFGLLFAGFIFFSLGYLGGGDAKLLGTAGLWFGFASLPQFLVLTVFAGGILALGVLAWSAVMFEAQFRQSGLAERLSWVKPSVPYGFAIAAGAILTVPGSWLGPAASISTWLTQI